MSHPHNPHPTRPEERLAALLRRGLGCANRNKALRALRHLDGQQFAEYCAMLAQPDVSGRRFLSGASFEDALQLYRFDAALRVLLFDAIQTIEMSLRAQWAYGPAEDHGPWFYADSSLFRGDFRERGGQKWSHREALAKLRQDYRRQQETLGWVPAGQLSHPLAWEMAGVMSFGQLFHWFLYLKRRRERESVASAYSMSEAVLRGFLPGLVAVRNICAHHGRLYGGSFRFRPVRSPEEPAVLQDSRGGRGAVGLYLVAAFMAFLLLQVDGAAHRRFAMGLRGLFGKHRAVRPRRLGFPGRWEQKPVWRL